MFIRLVAVEFKINLGHALSTQFLEQVAKKEKEKRKKQQYYMSDLYSAIRGKVCDMF